MSQPDRPLSLREIRAKKDAQRKAEKEKYRIKNLTAAQMMTLQLLAKDGSTKVIGQQTIQLYPGKTVELPRNRVIINQLKNLKRRGLISYHEVTA